MSPEQIEFLHVAQNNSVVTLKGFYGGVTQDDVADLLWESVGINVDPSLVSIAPHPTNPFVTVILNRACVADFLTRALAEKKITADASNFGLRRKR